jgi:hypothetical protein
MLDSLRVTVTVMAFGSLADKYMNASIEKKIRNDLDVVSDSFK